MSTILVSQTFALAQQHHRAGQLAEAEALYRQVLALQPGHAEAWRQLAAIAHQVGRHELSVKLIGHVLRLSPRSATAYFDLGGVYSAMGRWTEAVPAYQRALEIRPEFAEAVNDLGSVFARQDRLSEAEAAFRRAVQLRPEMAMPHSNLGNALKGLGRIDEAITAYRKAVALKPNDAETCVRLGLALESQGQLDEAAASYRQALTANPDLAEAHNNLGNVLKEGGQLDGAAAAYRRTLELRPDIPEPLTNLGNVFRDQERFPEAIACYEQALALDPRFADAHLNWGVVHWLTGRFEEAEARFREAIACRNDYPDAHLNLALMELLDGRYEQGWQEYEWRWQCPSHVHRRRHFSAPQWRGEPAPGRTILVHAEQGFGDALQFIRYLPLICQRTAGAQIIFECRPEQVALFKQFEGPQLKVIGRGQVDDALPPFDLQLPLLSAPLALREFAPLAVATPYLRADGALRSQWRRRLGSAPGFRVGLCWAGDPGHGRDRRRSIPTEKLSPLLEMPGINFVSLQITGDPLPEKLSEIGVVDFRAEIGDFSGSAALVAELDLVITVDTAMGHLAGALGRPVWVLVPSVPDWRWGTDGDDSPWYPGMRLYRQTSHDDWEDVLKRVAVGLRTWSKHELAAKR